MQRHEWILQPNTSVCVVVDFQEKLVPAMHGSEQLTAEVIRLVQGMNLLGVPLIVTEQYPQGLGKTLESVAQEFQNAEIVEKTSFSCCGSEPLETALQNTGRKQVVLAGIESHVCLYQTALDLVANGYQVHIPVESTGSRAEGHKQNALEQLRMAGCVVTNSETVLFSLLGDSRNPGFKAVQKLIK